VIARGRALYASPVRCNAELGDDFKFKGSFLVLLRLPLSPPLNQERLERRAHLEQSQDDDAAADLAAQCTT
jgi:hypothetical protein